MDHATDINTLTLSQLFTIAEAVEIDPGELLTRLHALTN